MILPSSYQATLALLVVAMICWGSWANTLKLAGTWRFELYYYDFALGFLLATVAAAFTLGSMNASELTFQENFLLTGYHNIAWAVAAGMVVRIVEVPLLIDVDPGFRDHLAQGCAELEGAVHFVQPFSDFRK